MFRSRLVAVFAAIFIVLGITGCKASSNPETAKTEAGAPQAAKAQESKGGKIVAEVGKEKITLEDIDKGIKEIPQQYQSMALSHKDMFLDSLINQKLLYAEAEKENFKKDPKVQKQIEDATKEILIRAYLTREVEDKVKVADEDAKNYYEANKDKFKEQEKLKVSHILVATEPEAKDILAKLKGGADFAALAKEKSIDTSNKDKGGDLGLIGKGQTVPEFEQAAFSLQPGQLSEVVKTQFGYHIIKAGEKQPEKQLSFDEVKDQLKQFLLSDKQKQRFEQLLKELKDKNKVIIYKDVLMPPAETKPAPSAVKPTPAQTPAKPVNK